MARKQTRTTTTHPPSLHKLHLACSTGTGCTSASTTTPLTPRTSPTFLAAQVLVTGPTLRAAQALVVERVPTLLAVQALVVERALTLLAAQVLVVERVDHRAAHGLVAQEDQGPRTPQRPVRALQPVLRGVSTGGTTLSSTRQAHSGGLGASAL